MKELAVKNYKTAEGQKISQGGNEFTVKPIVAQEDVTQCRVNFVEVEPGNFAYGYHYHETDEEVFYIISGTGIVRTINGDVTVKAGDAITFPAGPEGAHVIRNGSDTEKLVYLDFDTNNVPEIVHFPDTNQVMAYGRFSNGIYDKK
ncbi:cupin domain-containing protein [uncultured Bacteroides sp.]|uniref:cupin domain-containing protein n=1 Tax=uncultured Bacteroides sp. TaxID=162156 RepID=UPI0025D18CC8|nr:cupin domain-containing protein [uncultured Bacteroides sp.]